MDKAEAIRLLGGTATAAAREIGISTQAVTDWPDPLPPRIADRVQAALWRRQKAEEEPIETAPVAAGERRITAIALGVDLRSPDRDDSPEADETYRRWREKAERAR